jgi:cobalt-zinc-cadmium efflux system outer membrane protein
MVAQAANVRAAGADAAQSRAWLNPRIDTVLENLGAPASEGVSQRQNTYSITQPLKLGASGARASRSENATSLQHRRERQAQVAYAAELAVVYATAEAMLGRQALATENLARANEELAAARALVDSGKEASLRSAQARASVSAAQAAEAAATNDATQALARLSALSGASEPYTAVTSSLLTAQPAILNAPTALGESSVRCRSRTQCIGRPGGRRKKALDPRCRRQRGGTPLWLDQCQWLRGGRDGFHSVVRPEPQRHQRCR